MTKLEEKKKEVRKKLFQAFKSLKMHNPSTIESREIIEYVLKHGRIYKYQKVLMMVELLDKLNKGEYASLSS